MPVRDRALLHDCRLVRLETIDLPPGSLQLGSMAPQASAMLVASLLERLSHRLLVHDQISDHFFDAGHPLLQLLILLGYSLLLERQTLAQTISPKDKIRQPWIFPLPPLSTFVPPRRRRTVTLSSLCPSERHGAALGDCRQPKKTIGRRV